MSFKSVCRMIQISMNDASYHHAQHTWVERKEFLSTLYEANFSVADLYEAWALYHFAMLAIKVIQDHGKQEMAKASSSEETKELGTSLTVAINQLTAQGIYGFITVCILQSMYNLGMTAPEFYGWITEEQAENWKTAAAEAKIALALKGAGLLASTMAISNVVTVEVSFHAWLHHFKPGNKFWSTKVLVSLAFAQALILGIPPFSSLSVTGQNLFYASLLVAECFGVAVLHIIAWPTDEGWYNLDAAGDEFEASEKKLKAKYLNHKLHSAEEKLKAVAAVKGRLGDKTLVSPYVKSGPATGREPE